MTSLTKSFGAAIFLVFFICMLSIQELKAAEKREVQFYTNPPGSVNHSIAMGFCDMLKRYSTWLTGTVEVAWGIDALKLWSRDPARKRSAVANMSPQNIWDARNMGLLKDIQPLVILKSMTNNQFWVTWDSKIKSVSDFAGKRVSVGKKGTGLALAPELMFKELGVYDKVKISYMDFDGSASAFFDKTVDAAWSTVTLGRDKGMPVPAAMEIMLSEKPIYYVGVEQRVLDAVRQKTGYPLFTVVMPKGVMGKNQPEPLLTISFEGTWFGTPELDNEIAYEICKVMWDHIEDLGKYQKAGTYLTREDLPNASFPASMFHPGAIKFYSERKVKIGR